MPKRKLWYTRRANEVRGPFPQRLITSFVLIGRLKMDDEISMDQFHWGKIQDNQEIIPEEMQGDLSNPEAQEKLKLARYREDERLAKDRRVNLFTEKDEQRSYSERRTRETNDIVHHRVVKTGLRQDATDSKANYILRGFLLLSFLSAIITFSFMYSTPSYKKVLSRCDSIPAPQVNWNNCNMEGVVLDNYDLTAAQMQNVGMIGASFNGAKLTAGNLSYGNFGLSNLANSDLSFSKMMGTVLRKANLSYANLYGAKLSYAILQDSNLSHANLQSADLSFADLSGANIEEIDLTDAILGNATWIDSSICEPESIGECVHTSVAE